METDGGREREAKERGGEREGWEGFAREVTTTLTDGSVNEGVTGTLLPETRFFEVSDWPFTCCG